MTASASGIGHAAAQLLRERGNMVIGVDRRDADITTDLTTVDGRLELVRRATDLSHGGIGALLVIAGVSALAPVSVAMNYFGTLATPQGLRPLLARSAAPRAVAVMSMVRPFPVDERLLELMAAGEKPAALALISARACVWSGSVGRRRAPGRRRRA